MTTAKQAQADDTLARSLAGDPDARNRFVGRYVATVYGVVRRILAAAAAPDPSISPDDATQEVFLKLFRNNARVLRSYDPARASLGTWLAVVARTTAIDVLRKKRHATVPFEPERHSPAVEESEPPSAAPEIPPGLLSARQRLVMQLLYEQEVGVRETAHTLGVEEQTVRSTRHKALAKLRAFFAAGDDATRQN